MTFVLGLTGGIATGKSTADAFFQKKQIPVIDADEIAHHLYDKGKPAYQALVDEYGGQILNSAEEIERQKLGEIVFSDQSKLKELNRLTHPLIYQEIDQVLAFYKEKKTPVVVLDAPVLYETRGEDRCNAVLVITMPEELQIKRLMERNGFSQQEARRRIQAQLPLKEKEAKANYLIHNTGTIKELEEKLTKLLQKIEEEG